MSEFFRLQAHMFKKKTEKNDASFTQRIHERILQGLFASTPFQTHPARILPA
ncbi:hypothetical protein [Deinococcus maricopensis]|uniref:Uncharacterized protein n=1 Tax=Deinococcus maricopensis (strain DSM 21211 / LMG 22137 / NRRL B-23946 / LB-34) TaxID=709986 RepID=E8U8N2_DEIML|nr:hypothetical protein [Deinococcus maricopensis]ADV67421.1 hypothetical protein Deima_1772 [Deinococcus maricopensis DSM 21211]